MRQLTAICAAVATTLGGWSVQAAEIDVQLTTTLPGVRAVRIEAVPREGALSAGVHIPTASEVKSSGGEKTEGFFDTLAVEAGNYIYPFVMKLLDAGGGVVYNMDDDTPYDTTPIVDIFIDTDCEDCGDYDFVVPPPPPGSQPGTVAAHIELSHGGTDARVVVKTTGNNIKNPAATAVIEILPSKDPSAPVILQPVTTIALDKVTVQFADDLIFKEGEPAGITYDIYTSWMDEKGVQIGQKEVFTAVAEVSKTRKDGTKVYKPWRFHSDLSVVVGETWTIEGQTDTYMDAAALQVSFKPTDGGPGVPVQTLVGADEYVQRAQTRDVVAEGPLKADHVWFFEAQLFDVNGKALGAPQTVQGEAVLDEEGKPLPLDKCAPEQVICIPGVRVRYTDETDPVNPAAVIVTAPRILTSLPATTLRLKPITRGSTGPVLVSKGGIELELEIDVKRLVFTQDMTVLFPAGLTPAGDDGFTYEVSEGWLNRDAKLIAVPRTTVYQLSLRPNGGGWTWVAVTHDNSGIRIK